MSLAMTETSGKVFQPKIGCQRVTSCRTLAPSFPLHPCGILHRLRGALIGCSLFVGNLSYATTEVDLRTYFGTVAPPSQVVLPVDRETGRTRGFAFVEYLDRAHAEQAIQKFNGVAFNGRPLAVSEARAREDRGPGVDRRVPADSPGPRPGGGFAASAYDGPVEASAARDSIRRRRRLRAAAATSVPTRSPRADRTPRRSRRTPNVRGVRFPQVHRRSFSLDDDKDVSDEPMPDIDDFATSKPQDKEKGARRQPRTTTSGRP